MIGSFTIQDRLGSGAMGAVYLARSPGGRLVAVKVVRDELAGDAAFRARFAREIEAARKAGGAFTAAVVDADPDAERPWLATEYLPGPTLQKAIDTSGPLTPGGVQSLAGGLAEALMEIHASGLTHRDLKPSNIVLTDNGPRVIDFGIARALEEASLTATGVVVGTPGHLSPEQILGTAIGPPSDVFALGAVLVFAAAGCGPFAHGNPASLLHRVVHEQPQFPPLPSPLQDAERHCLAWDPAQRPTPAELLRFLGPPANTAVLIPPAETCPFPLPPTKLLPTHLHPQPAQPQPEQQHPVATAFFGIVDLIFLYFAIRGWHLVLRRRVVLRLSPQGLTVERGYEQATVPWSGVTRLRVGGDVRRPWLIAWLEPPYQDTLPAPRRGHHRGLRIYPIAHGATVNRRIRQVDELRAALNWYAGHLHDNSY